MIRNVVIHMQGDQPLLADIEALPSAADACLVCTNVRTNDGKKPTFIDHTNSWFLIPLIHVRFVEIPAGALASLDGAVPPMETAIVPVEEPDELEVDEDFLRKIREA
jgi:hypothetical protein